MSDSCHHHGCAPPAAAQSTHYRRVLWAALVGNATMFAIEVGAGLQSVSVALLADAVDFFGNTANYGITLMVLGMSLTWRAPRCSTACAWAPSASSCSAGRPGRRRPASCPSR